ncbi:hypothetical protein ACP70R_004529 [Stipagrostis hirtigluma subsp. patula]
METTTRESGASERESGGDGERYSRVAGIPAGLRVSKGALREIFLHLDSPADLTRASTACAHFRRIITDHGFLRRYHAVHPPPLLGILASSFIPAEPPHPSAVAARAFAQAGAADFSFSFLPSPHRWRRRDVRIRSEKEEVSEL